MTYIFYFEIIGAKHKEKIEAANFRAARNIFFERHCLNTKECRIDAVHEFKGEEVLNIYR